MNTRIPSTSLLIAASLSSLIFTVSAGATGTNRKAIEVKTGNSVEAAAPQDRYLIAGSIGCGTMIDPKPPTNVRSGPGTNYKVIGTLPKGAFVSLVQKKNGWVRITNESVVIDGWVSAKLVRATKCR